MKDHNRVTRRFDTQSGHRNRSQQPPQLVRVALVEDISQRLASPPLRPRPRAKVIAPDIDMIPIPPIEIITSTTPWPSGVQTAAVSTVTKPVTQVALTAVRNAPKDETGWACDTGRQKKSAYGNQHRQELHRRANQALADPVHQPLARLNPLPPTTGGDHVMDCGQAGGQTPRKPSRYENREHGGKQARPQSARAQTNQNHAEPQPEDDPHYGIRHGKPKASTVNTSASAQFQ